MFKTNESSIEYITTSVDIAKKFDKRHDRVLRIIHNSLERHPEIKNEFLKSYYLNIRKIPTPCYKITKKGNEFLENKIKYNIRSARFEIKFSNELFDFCRYLNIKVLDQYVVNPNYRLDFYLPDFNIAIEYDEKEHEYPHQKQKDIERQKNVENILGCKFIRIKYTESVGESLARVIDIILKKEG